MTGHDIVPRAAIEALAERFVGLGLGQGAAAFVLGQDVLAVLAEHGYAVVPADDAVKHQFELAEWGEIAMACGASFCVHCQPERMEERCNHADVQSVTETGPEVSPKPGGDPKSPEIGDAP